MKKPAGIVKFLALLILAAQCACAGAPAVTLDRLGEGASIEGVWQDVKWGDLITVRKESGVYKVTAVIDSQSAEEFSVQSSTWDGKTVSYKYTIPSNKTTVIASLDMVKGEFLAGSWRLDDNTNSGKFTCKRMMTGVVASAKKDDAGKKESVALFGKVYQIKGDVIVIASGLMAELRPHDTVYLYIDARKVGLTVLFPMMTIAKCALVPADAGLKERIETGMPVYR
jgi:hypothetical protein